MKKHKKFFLLCLSLFSVPCLAQDAQIDSLKNALSAATNDSIKVEALLVLSKKLIGTSPEEAIANATHAKELAEKIKYPRGVALAYKNIGLVHLMQGEYVDAIRVWEQSLAVFESIGDKVGIANIQSNIGVVYFNQSEDEKALEYYLKSLKASEEANDTFRILTALINIGVVYANKPHTYKKALEFLHRALPLAEVSGDDESIGMTTVNLGEAYFKTGDDTSALKYLERSLKAFEDYPDRIPYAFNYIGMVYLKRNDYKLSMGNYQQAYDAAEKLDSRLEMGEALVGMAKTQYQSGEARQSIATYKQAEEILIALDTSQSLKDTYEGLALAYADQSDYDNAYKYQTLLGSVKDKLYDFDIAKKMQVSQFTFDLWKKETEVTLLTKDKEIQKAEIAREKLARNGFMGGFALMLLFASVVSFQRHRISKEKKRSDELLLNILPSETAEELKATGTAKAKSFDLVSVLFTDFKNFTQASEKLSAEELVKEINYCYSEFDKIITRHGIEKIKTIGDSYMCAGGLPVSNSTHAADTVQAGLEMQRFISNHKQERMAADQPYFDLRLGIHTGPVVAGIVGIKKFAYDIWGDTVNTASRMESSGEIGKVNISGATFELVKDKFKCVHRGKVQAKNKGEIDMYFVEASV